MTVELTPLGVKCNLSCGYCYQHPMRDAGNFGAEAPYDFQKMFAALDQEGAAFSVFGGEPLLVPLPDLIRIFEHGFAKWKQNGIQTNGVLITPAHIEVFLKYNVHVGFSLDGPDDMNDSRWAGTLEKTRESSARSHANLRACIEAGVSTSCIITLYKGNAAPDKLPRLKDWIRELDRIGSRGVRIHLLEIDHPVVRERMQLPQDQTIAALRELIVLERELSKSFNIGVYPTREEAERVLAEYKGQHPRVSIWERKKNGQTESYVVWSQGLDLDILRDMRNLLRGEDEEVTCTWNPCDPYTTSAVRGVDGQGNKSNCGRTNKDGIVRLKAERHGYERQLALYHTPYEDNGCKGCRFFLMCKSQCPGTAIDGDWRNRSSDCRVWMTLFEDLEREMMLAGETPLSLSPVRPTLEKAMLSLWERGQNVPMKRVLAGLAKGGSPAQVVATVNHSDAPHGDEHGDHTDMGLLRQATEQEHGDTGHQDVPHGDDHGDHTDYGSRTQPLGVAAVENA